jgi:hypothetical protein
MRTVFSSPWASPSNAVSNWKVNVPDRRLFALGQFSRFAGRDGTPPAPAKEPRSYVHVAAFRDSAANEIAGVLK